MTIEEMNAKYGKPIGATTQNSNPFGFTQPKAKEPSTLSKIGGAIIGSEKAFGQDIAAGATSFLPDSWTGQKQLNEAQAIKEKTANDIIKKIGEVRAKGEDTSKWLKLLSDTTGQEIPTMADLYPAMKKSNLQIAGDAGGVLLDILSAGSYGNAIKGAETGKLLVKGGGAVETLATKAGVATTQKIVTPVIKDVAQKTLTESLKTIGKKTATRAVVGAGTGYAYDVSQNLQSGATGANIAKPGMGTLLGGTIPIAIGSIQAGVAITKSTAPRFINSLIKPKQADFSYGKDPGRTVSEMGITGNNMDDFANNIGTKKNEVGTQLGAIYSSPANAGIAINANDEIAKLDAAIEKASKGGKQNQGIVTALQDTKDALLYEHKNVDGIITKVGDTPRDLSKLNPQEAFDLKKVIAEQTKFTGKPSDDKTVNSILKNMYGGLKTKLNTALSKNNPEIIKLNQQYADLTSAEIATLNRDAIVKRADMISMPIKFGTVAGIVTAIGTGGAAIPAILVGASAWALEKAFASTAVKTRIAAWLGSATPSMISKIPPEIKTVLYRALPKFASQLGQTKPNK